MRLSDRPLFGVMGIPLGVKEQKCTSKELGNMKLVVVAMAAAILSTSDGFICPSNPTRRLTVARFSLEPKDATDETEVFAGIEESVISKTLAMVGIAKDDGESSIYMGFLRRKSSDINPRAMAMETVEQNLMNIPTDERLRRFRAGDIAIISVLLSFALTPPPTLLSPLISLPFLYLSLGYVLSGKEGL